MGWTEYCYTLASSLDESSTPWPNVGLSLSGLLSSGPLILTKLSLWAMATSIYSIASMGQLLPPNLGLWKRDSLCG